MDIHPGEFVCTIKGRDKGNCFLVIAKDDTYVYLADGKHRKVTDPKKKKLKHVVFVGASNEALTQMLKEDNMPTNKQIRYSLRKYKESVSEQNC